MRLFTLGARLETAAGFIPQGASVADIGTDHARLPIWLVKTGRSSHVIASDIADDPVRRARENVARWKVSDAVRVVQGAGFANVAPEAFTHAVICGMGGETIAAILAESPWLCDARYTLILQAETASKHLREYLYQNHFTICDEIAVRDGKRVFAVMCVRAGDDPHAADALYARVSAPLLTRHDDAAQEYVARAKKSLLREMQGMTADSDEYRAAATLRDRLTSWEVEHA